MQIGLHMRDIYYNKNYLAQNKILWNMLAEGKKILKAK